MPVITSGGLSPSLLSQLGIDSSEELKSKELRSSRKPRSVKPIRSEAEYRSAMNKLYNAIYKHDTAKFIA